MNRQGGELSSSPLVFVTYELQAFLFAPLSRWQCGLFRLSWWCCRDIYTAGFGQGETAEHLLHLGCLAGQLFSCSGAFFGTGSVLLGDLVDQSQTVGDFTDALRLIARCSSDFLEQIGDPWLCCS